MLIHSHARDFGLAALGIGLSSLLVGCSSIEKDETPGELGNGAFRYVCVDDDAMCPNGGAASKFPERIATRARFDVSYQLFEDGSDADVSPASTDLIESSGAGFRTERSGIAALLARRTLDGVTVDFTHLQIEDTQQIRVETASGQPMQLVMEVGSSQELRAVPLDALDAPLAGSVAFDWTTSDDGVLALELLSPAARMRVAAVASGTATVTVQSGELWRELEVTVP